MNFKQVIEKVANFNNSFWIYFVYNTSEVPGIAQSIYQIIDFPFPYHYQYPFAYPFHDPSPQPRLPITLPGKI